MEKTVYQGQYIKVTELKTENHTWEKAYFSDSLVVFPITKENEIIMVVEKRPHEINKERLKFITGHIDKGETPLACANREMQEEAGFAANKLEEFFIHRSSGTINSNFHYILATDIYKSKLPNPDGEDTIIEVKKIPLHQLKRMIDKEEFPLSLACLGLFKIFKNFLKD